MKNRVIGFCPICDNQLKVTKLGCDRCGTELSGKFYLSKFSYLDEDELRFIELFIKNQGNIKALSGDLGVSYPTIKKMLSDVIQSLGYEIIPGNENAVKVNKSEILKKIESGEISPEEGFDLLNKN